MAAVVMLVGVQIVFATTAETSTTSVVKSIKLQGANDRVYWTVEGVSAQGFKVVWSKNSLPVYPLREGDRYHYYSESSKNNDTLEAFSGAGTYHVRVCEYLGGKCGVYSNEISLTLGKSEAPVACTMEYAPVCGELQVQCIKAPCPPIKTTYGNKCSLNAAKAKFLYAGECKKEVKSLSAEEYAKKRVSEMETKVKKMEKENKRLYSLIKLREKEIKMLRESLEQ